MTCDLCNDEACGRFLLEDMNELNLCPGHLAVLEQDNMVIGREY